MLAASWSISGRWLGRFLLSLVACAGLSGPARADDWPQWLGPRRDGVWRETGILSRFPRGGPRVLWRTPVNDGYAGPAVAGKRVYVMDRVLARDAQNPADPFQKGRVAGQERVLCLDAATGKELWKHAYDCTYTIAYPRGPRATPVIHEGKVYTLGAMGDLYCFEADTGKVVWSKNFIRDFKARVPVWGFASHPLIDGDRLITLVGGKGSVAVAFHKDTGKVLWRSLSVRRSEIGYCPPMIYQAKGADSPRQLIIWHPESVNSLNPETGEVYWSQPFKVKANLSIPTPRLSGDFLFITSFYDGSLLLKLAEGKPAATEVWRSHGRGETPGYTDKLHSIMSTPFVVDGHIYGVCSYGELRCLRLSDGKRLWMTLKATIGGDEPERWSNAFLVRHEDRFFLFNEKGDLLIARLTPRGYDEIDRAHILEPTGKANGRPILWSHPAFAHKAMFARNDKEIVCVSLEK